MTEINVTQELLEKIREFFRHVFSSEQNTQLFLEDPDGAFSAHDIDPGMLAHVNIEQLVNSCAYAGGPSGGSGGSGGAGGGGGGGGYVPPPQAVQQVTQVTQNFYQDHSTNVDNSITVHAEKGSHVDVDATNVTATGERSVAVGDDVYDSQVNTGDGAVQAGSDIEGPVNTGSNTGIIADGSVEDVVMGDNSGTFVGGDVDRSVLGDNTGVAGDIDVEDGDFKFAQGDLLDQEHATDSVGVTGGVGGDAINANDAYAAPGGALNIGGEGGDTTGNNVYAEDSVVGTEQGKGDFEQTTEEGLDLGGLRQAVSIRETPEDTPSA